MPSLLVVVLASLALFVPPTSSPLATTTPKAPMLQRRPLAPQEALATPAPALLAPTAPLALLALYPLALMPLGPRPLLASACPAPARLSLAIRHS